jgi:hypothetical protein
VEEARDGDVNFGHGVTADPYYAYDKANPEKFKRFKTRTGAKAFAEKHGWVIASAGFFYDNVKVKQDVDEGSMAAAAHKKSGPKFGGYYGATQKGPPKAGQGFGGAAESAGSKISIKGKK